jgi:FkbM family methyltransferase
MDDIAGTRLLPNVQGFDPATARRVLMTTSCRDADSITKVDDAGAIRDEGGRRVQVMHNGVLVEAGAYYGEWMAEIIRCLRGHHEPQEERVFDQIMRRLTGQHTQPAMIEFGSFWTYYGLWFCHAIPGGRVVAVEPDSAYLEVGRRNAALNDLSDAVTFVHAAIGDEPGRSMPFQAESDGHEYPVQQCDLDSVLRGVDLERVDLVLADVQGAETMLLRRAVESLRAGRVRFLVVSTHHHSISNWALTHQDALRLLTDLGAHVICEHTVGESFSGDGLIAVSFDERDRELAVEVSRARTKDSLFGELEFDLAAAEVRGADEGRRADAGQADVERLGAGLADAQGEVAHLRARLAQAQGEGEDLRRQLNAIFATKLWRWSQRPREEYARLRRLGG